jgi:hypothetical protein
MATNPVERVSPVKGLVITMMARPSRVCFHVESEMLTEWLTKHYALLAILGHCVKAEFVIKRRA